MRLTAVTSSQPLLLALVGASVVALVACSKSDAISPDPGSPAPSGDSGSTPGEGDAGGGTGPTSGDGSVNDASFMDASTMGGGGSGGIVWKDSTGATVNVLGVLNAATVEDVAMLVTDSSGVTWFTTASGGMVSSAARQLASRDNLRRGKLHGHRLRPPRAHQVCVRARRNKRLSHDPSGRDHHHNHGGVLQQRHELLRELGEFCGDPSEHSPCARHCTGQSFYPTALRASPVTRPCGRTRRWRLRRRSRRPMPRRQNDRSL